MLAIAHSTYRGPHLVKAVEGVGSRVEKKCAILLFPKDKIRVEGKRSPNLSHYDRSLLVYLSLVGMIILSS
jgi:hypothetical protein